MSMTSRTLWYKKAFTFTTRGYLMHSMRALWSSDLVGYKGSPCLGATRYAGFRLRSIPVRLTPKDFSLWLNRMSWDGRRTALDAYPRKCLWWEDNCRAILCRNRRVIISMRRYFRRQESVVLLKCWLARSSKLSITGSITNSRNRKSRLTWAIWS